jgi:glutathione S-transferase
MAAVAKRLVVDVLPARFVALERACSTSGGPYLCGNSLTTADLAFYVVASGLRDGTYCEGVGGEGVLAACPLLARVLELVGSEKRIAGWLSK